MDQLSRSCSDGVILLMLVNDIVLANDLHESAVQGVNGFTDTRAYPGKEFLLINKFRKSLFCCVFNKYRGFHNVYFSVLETDE